VTYQKRAWVILLHKTVRVCKHMTMRAYSFTVRTCTI